MRMFSSGTQGLGWFLAGMLLLSSQAWGLDLDVVIAQNESSSAQILGTLGRDKQVNATTSKSTAKMVHVKLLKKNKKAKARKHRKSRA